MRGIMVSQQGESPEQETTTHHIQKRRNTMTAREYAKTVGVEIVGKLTRKTGVHTKYSARKDEYLEDRFTYYVDEAGNEFIPDGTGGWCCVTAEGGVC